ncbi:cupin domain-containing protein [Rhodanobacter sp. L36]|uniref:cupin domain-containing protein n=1 Tax=Rhodanobacter sp. L36 TaxID=1747221 RepID=UPI00131AA3F9|nr:cupin domain-containing protein [Rhodanobacter sp. L36]
MSSNESNQMPSSAHWSLLETLDRLPLPATVKWPNGVYDDEVMQRAGVSLSIFAPMISDFQTPHAQDEIYIVVSGNGDLQVDDKVLPATKGDAIFVAARTPHRFVRFSEDFATWVVFFPAAGAPHGAEVST